MTSPPIPRLKKMVELMLEENPKYNGIEVRNSDVALMIVIWQRWYSVGTRPESVVHLYRLLDLPREDNIKRVRAYFQNTEGKYLPTSWEVAKKRGIEREVWERALGYKLSAAEIRTHKQTVKDTTPPKSALEEIAEMTPKDIKDVGDRQQLAKDLEKPLANLREAQEPYTTKMTAIYRIKGFSKESYLYGQVYELELERLAVGKPVKIVAPIPMGYPDLRAFRKAWRVHRD